VGPILPGGSWLPQPAPTFRAASPMRQALSSRPETGLVQSTASEHLCILKAARIITGEMELRTAADSLERPGGPGRV
jgi:hypothetical protein